MQSLKVDMSEITGKKATMATTNNARMSNRNRSLNSLEERLEKEMQDLDAADRRAKRLQDRIEELEAKLAKVVGLLEAWVNVATHCTIEDGVCCCGDNMDTHAEPMDCGHSPVDHGAYIAMGLAEETETTLAELTGGKP